MKKTPLNNLDEVAKELKNKLGGVDKILKDVGESLRIINSPVKEKNVSINGQNCTMSMLEDNRIIIRFSTKDEKDVYYEQPPVITTEVYAKDMGRNWKLGIRANEEALIKLSWWDRIFYKPQYYGTEDGKKLYE